LNKENKFEAGPTAKSKNNVDQSSLLVAAKPFKPDDAHQNWRTKDDSEY
jgi:hypothetical protein